MTSSLAVASLVSATTRRVRVARVMKGPYPHPQMSTGPHRHSDTVHSHRTWEGFHGHGGLPIGPGEPVESETTAQEAFDALRSQIVDQGVHPDLATMAARSKFEARPFA